MVVVLIIKWPFHMVEGGHHLRIDSIPYQRNKQWSAYVNDYWFTIADVLLAYFSCNDHGDQSIYIWHHMATDLLVASFIWYRIRHWSNSHEYSPKYFTITYEVWTIALLINIWRNELTFARMDTCYWQLANIESKNDQLNHGSTTVRHWLEKKTFKV